MALLVMGRAVLLTMVEGAPTTQAPWLAAAMDELYAGDLVRVEAGMVFIDDLREGP